MKLSAQEQTVIKEACRIIEREFLSPLGDAIADTAEAKRYVALKLAGERREVFLAIWLSAQLRVVAIEEVSRGTLTETTVHGREIARSALEHDAAFVILAHNHPGGGLEFSDADRELTAVLRRILIWIDVRLIDHLLVGNGVASLVDLEAREEQYAEQERERERLEARERRRNTRAKLQVERGAAAQRSPSPAERIGG